MVGPTDLGEHVASPQTPPALPEVARRKPWGFWSTFVWAIIIFALSFLPGIIVAGVMGIESEGDSLALTEVIAMPISVLLVVVCIRFRKWRVREYLALKPPGLRETVFWLGATALWYVLFDIVQWTLGFPVVPDVQVAIYASASNILLLWFAIVAAAPVIEEICFRGFIFTGWSNSRLGATGATVLLSLIFGALHLDYGALGAISAFMIGVMLAIARVHTQSLYVCVMMHAFVNLISTVETAIAVAYAPIVV